MSTEPFDQRVSRALAAIRAGDPLGMGQLYDLPGPSDLRLMPDHHS